MNSSRKHVPSPISLLYLAERSSLSKPSPHQPDVLHSFESPALVPNEFTYTVETTGTRALTFYTIAGSFTSTASAASSLWKIFSRSVTAVVFRLAIASHSAMASLNFI